MKNVKDFGAVGDGATKDTAAIQAAIDAGGTVFFPEGTYLSGTLYLRNHTTLLLDDSAVILGSPDPEDYNAPDAWPQNWASTEECTTGKHLIVALEVQHVAIRGGRIDGNRQAFFDPDTTPWREFKKNGWRPAQMVYFCESTDIRITDTELTNSPYWTCFIYGCDDVFIDRVKIREDNKRTWNGDGIDIDCSRNVIVSNCNIQSSDDSLTVRAAGAKRLRHHPLVSENIVVSNCILSSNQACIRMGVGTGAIRNCTFSNLIMQDSSYGICINSCYMPRIFPTSATGVSIENVIFDTIVMDLHVPINVSATWDNKPVTKSGNTVRAITMKGIRAIAQNGIYMQGNLDFNHADITVQDSTFEFTGGECGPDFTKGLAYWYRKPCACFLENMKDVLFNAVTFRWNAISEHWQNAVTAVNCPGLEFLNCNISEPKDN